ncbi:rhomboid family intramembrane serine protease [Candidatus Pacearchaeota archaeon]|nr:rhomboid family intramembrane serine protease [Candidatus Pacearchaeota archaeon]
MSYRKRGIYRSLFSLFLGSMSTTNWIIVANVVLFIIFYILILANPNFINYIALKPSSIFQGKNLWTLLTHMFAHSGFAHLFFNMFSLYFIGNFIEKIAGKKRLLWFYILSGIFAGIFLTLLSGFFGSSAIGEKIFNSPDIPGVGASGAIFGLIGLIAVLTPLLRVYLILGPLIAIIAQSLLSKIIASSPINSIIGMIVNIYFFISILAIVSFNPRLRKLALPLEMPFWLLPIIAIVPLVIIGLFVPLPIGNMAHLGGLIAGIIYAFYLKRKYKKKLSVLNRIFR